jgi:motility quorum-sensing regulator/GCU-specific mRNA interferase toxin
VEKRTPHYRLAKVQAVVADPESRPFTVTALRGGLVLGLTELEMRHVVLALSRLDFYKSMTTYADSTYWHHGMTQDCVPVYIKITRYGDSRLPVIQFKEK